MVQVPYFAPFIVALVSFLVVWFLTPWLIRYLKKINLVVKDMNKEDTPNVPVSGGVAVMIGIVFGLMLFIFVRTFFNHESVALILDDSSLALLFAAIISILIISFIGFADDLIIKRSGESSSGLKQWQKPLLTLAAAVPLMAIKAGFTTMNFLFIGDVNFGVLYPLLLIPIGVVGAANMVNMLAGFNGMETGMGIVYIGMLGLYAFVNDRHVAALIALVAVASLIAFYYYNKYPAKVLPGDSLTYLLGALVAVIAIVGNLEKAALIISIPFFIEFVLKMRSKLKANSYGYFKDGKIYSKYEKIYSIPHIFTRTGRFTEKQVTYFMVLIQLIVSSLIWFV